MAIRRNPAYTGGMDAKTRYRQRLKLQAALANVLKVLNDNHAKGIPPDRTTAKLAAQIARWLMQFAADAGVDLPSGDEPDLSRYTHLRLGRRKATLARYRRFMRQIARLRARAAATASAPRTAPLPPTSA